MSFKKIALIGNPNIGKSTLFNGITGLKQRVGNYPGTTVEKRVGFFDYKGKKVKLYDFPGTYSLYPKSADEEVVFDILSNPNHPDFPDGVIIVGSPLQLSRSLILYQQARDLELPVIFILNKIDEVSQTGHLLNLKELSLFMQKDLLTTNARTGENISLLKEHIISEFPVYKSEFDTPTLYKKAVDSLKEKLSISNDYLAWQYLAQPQIDHLSKNERDLIAQVKKEHHIVSQRLQINESLHRHKETDAVAKKVVVSEQEDKESITDKLDKIFTHPFWGYIIFFGLLFLAFQAIYSWAAAPMDFIDSSFASLQTWAGEMLGSGPLSRLVVDGFIPGIGGVVIFIPQIFILILFLLILEESGYMSRVVFLMDKWMRPFGLNGKSVVPLMSGAACAIPGIMAARNIENTKERLITVLVTPFMTCSARLPVYAILIALVIPKETFLGFNLQGIVLMSLYLIGVLAALLFAFIFNKSLKSPYKSYLIMEMPNYRIPHWRNVVLGLWEKVTAFVFGAGKIILAVSIILMVLSSWGFSDSFKNADTIIARQAEKNQWTEHEAEQHLESYKLENSLLGSMGKTIEPLFRPLGYDWKISIGVLSSFAAREVFVSTMASIYSLGGDNDDENQIIHKMQRETRADGSKVFNLATGVSLMLFYAFAMQCLSTLAVVKRETHGWKWPIIQLVFMSGFAYITAMIAYQLLS